jgi:type II secretory pathway component GspD/PulD (secretin)
MLNRYQTERRGTKCVRVLFAVALAVTFFVSCASAQTPSADGKAAEPKPAPGVYRTFYLANLTQQDEINDLQIAIRNTIPNARLYAVESQGVIAVRASADDLLIAQKIISDLDRPRTAYRLTYTMTETDGGKRVGSQHFVMIAVSGQKTELKQGSRVPIVTGTVNAGTATQNSQVQYVDMGLSIQATLSGTPNNLRLRTKVEQSSLAEEHSGLGAQDPVIRQTVLEGASILAPGKALVLGSLDLPGSARKLEIEVVVEPVK